MVLILQAVIWVIGISYAIYIAVFEMFISGLSDVITSTTLMIKYYVTNSLVVYLFLGIVKIIFSSVVFWLIIMVTSFLATMVGDYLE